MSENFKVQKIKVKQDDELTDLVTEISGSDADSIAMIFAEPSDMLISPVNLRVIQETADEKDIPIIFQIFDSRAGLRNAASIHAVFTDKAEEITNDMWDRSYKQMKERQQKHLEALKRGSNVSMTMSEADEVEEPLGKQDVDDGIDGQIAGVITENDSEEAKMRSEFRERIDRVLEKSKQDISEQKAQTIEAGGLTIAVDHDIADIDQEGSAEDGDKKTVPGLSSRDLLNKPISVPDTTPTQTHKTPSNSSHLPRMPIITTDKDEDHGSRQTYGSYQEKPKGGDGNNKIGAILTGVVAKIKTIVSNKKFQKIGLLILLPLIAITSLVLLLVYRNAPRVTVEIYIESRPVEIELELTGSPAVETYDLEEKKVPVMRRTVNKERSDNTSATGTATRGTKAGGVVKFVCGPINGETNVPKTIPAGTILTVDPDGKTYVLNSDVSFTCPSLTSPTGTAEATDFGNEYNISAGKLFKVAGDPDVVATSETSFTGGSVEEYRVISQEDFRRVVDPLQEASFREAERELEQAAEGGWEMIPSTISSRLDGEVITDYPVGAEADILNVTVKTISTALYYKRSDIEAEAKELLLNEAGGQNLFESDKDLDLQLGDDFTQDIQVIGVEGEVVTIKVTLSGAVKPLVDKDDLIKDLAGMRLSEGEEYLDGLNFVAKESVIKFTPDYFPLGLRYFPTQQGKLRIDIKQVTSNEVADDIDE